MHIGQVLIAAESAISNYYSPWFPRGGNGAKMACQVIADGGLDDFSILVQTKNSEDDDAAAVAFGTAQTITRGTAYKVTAWDVGTTVDGTGAGMKELVRFKYIVEGPTTPGSIMGWVHFRMLAPQWLTNGA